MRLTADQTIQKINKLEDIAKETIQIETKRRLRKLNNSITQVGTKFQT